MKLLLDENRPHELRFYFPTHDVRTVAYMGWGGLRNGLLLVRAAENGFDALITMDANVEFQQNMGKLPLAVIVFRARSNTIAALHSVVPKIIDAIDRLQPCTLVRID